VQSDQIETPGRNEFFDFVERPGGQIAELIEHGEVEAGQMVGDAPQVSGPGFGLQPIDRVDGAMLL
jgi:hypothetical protein